MEAKEKVKAEKVSEWTTLRKAKRYTALIEERETEKMELAIFTVAEELAYEGSEWVAGKQQTRYSVTQVVKTTKGTYLLLRQNVTHWQGETGHYTITAHKTLADIANELNPILNQDHSIINQLQLAETVAKEI